MQRTFIQTSEFSKQWDNMGFTDAELRHLESELMEQPDRFPVIPGTGGLRKMRFAHENEGKRGGVRVCYVDFVFAETIYLITAYPKKEKSDLTPAECRSIKQSIEKLKASLE